MGSVASREVIVNLDNNRQISVTADRDVHLKIFAYRGSLGVSLTIEEATELWKGLCSAITRVIAETN